MLTAYSSYLKQEKYSDNTIRNYLSDLSSYFRWSVNQGYAQNLQDYSKFLTVSTLSTYFSLIQQQKSYSRSLASLRSFCQFALNQNFIHKDVVNSALQNLSKNSNQLLEQFSAYLKKQKVSDNTLRNYLGDVNQYLSWLNEHPTK